jgi:hypothetical protein
MHGNSIRGVGSEIDSKATLMRVMHAAKRKMFIRLLGCSEVPFKPSVQAPFEKTVPAFVVSEWNRKRKKKKKKVKWKGPEEIHLVKDGLT